MCACISLNLVLLALFTTLKASSGNIFCSRMVDFVVNLHNLRRCTTCFINTREILTGELSMFLDIRSHHSSYRHYWYPGWLEGSGRHCKDKLTKYCHCGSVREDLSTIRLVRASGIEYIMHIMEKPRQNNKKVYICATRNLEESR
jgi:hypothetical protein